MSVEAVLRMGSSIYMNTTCSYNVTYLLKSDTFMHNNFDQYLLLIARHQRKSMKFGNLKEQFSYILNTCIIDFLYKLKEWRVIKSEHLIKMKVFLFETGHI